MPMIEHNQVAPVEMMPGVFRRIMTDGERMMLCEIRLEKGAVVPSHTHPHEQTGYMMSGRLRFQIGDEVRDLSAGDSWMIPGGSAHEVTALEECLVIECFSPPREDFR